MGDKEAYRLLLRDLEQVVGPNRVSDALPDRLPYQQGQGAAEFVRGIPDLIVMPSTVEEISRVLLLANRAHVPVVPRGGGASQFGGNIATRGGIMIDMSRLDKILSVDEENMVVTAEGGCSVYKIMNELDRRGFEFPIGAVFTPGPQIGACVAVNSTGHHMVRNGRLGDNIVGLEVVLPTGEVVTLGSGAYTGGKLHYHRYTGTPDLIGLFVNSSGMLGIITKVAVQFNKKPNYLGYLTVGWPRAKAKDLAVCLLRLQQENVYDGFLMNSWAIAGQGYQWNTAQKRDANVKDEFFLALTIDGYTEADLKFKEEYFSSVCKQQGGIILGPAVAQTLVGPPNYEAYSVVGISARKAEAAGLQITGRSLVTYFYCPVLRLPAVYDLWENMCKKYDYWNSKYAPAWLSWCSRSGINPFPMLATVAIGDKNELAKCKMFWDEFNTALIELGGCQYAYGPTLPYSVFERLGPASDLVRKIKRCLDPNGIMNPFLEGQ